MKKPYVRRLTIDRSQAIRHAIQWTFLALNVWIGTQFYLFVRQHELGLPALMSRPAGVEGWLPIAGMMNTRYFVLTGDIPRIHPAAMFLFMVFVGASLLMRKAFCGWLCPIGTISEQLWKFGRKTFRRVFFPLRWLDIPLRGLKYLLLGFFAYAVFSMTALGLESFLESPYGLVADVKMLNFFRHLGPVGAGVLGVLIIGSFFVPNLWCRYLCPYGALMGLTALFSPMRIRRNTDACIDCGKCAKACPSHLPVDQLVQIKSAECIGCYECVAICPAENALAMQVRKTPVRPWMVAAALAALFFGVTGYAKLSGHWESPVPGHVYRELIPNVDQFDHPR